MKSSHRSLVIGITVCLIAIVFSLLLVEIGLRISTQFPVSYNSNQTPDPELGYRISPKLDDIDSNGFRNPEGEGTYSVVAVGDSHTFGNNVISEQSWPSVLASETGTKVYNTGVGSYGIATYHAIVTKFLNRNSQQIAIVAVYPGNDFQPNYSFCEIDFGSVFWLQEQRRLKIHLGDIQSECVKNKVDRNWKKWAVGNVAILSAFEQLILFPIRINSRSTQLPAGLPNVDLTDRPIGNAKLMQQSEKIFADWGSTWRGRVAIIIIPSKERVFYQIILNRNVANLAPKNLTEIVSHQIDIEDFVISQAILNKIPVENALIDSIPVMDQNLYPTYDGHPFAPGYVAYAQSADRVLKKLQAERAASY